MFGSNKDQDKKGAEPPKRVSPPAFGSKPTSNAPINHPQKQPLGAKPPASNKLDNFQKTNKAERGPTGQLTTANANLNLTKENREYAETPLEDGSLIIKYKEPQKIDNLIQDAKSRMGSENSKFFSKGWVIGTDIAKIAPDGLSITFYPREVSDLVQELIGYPSMDEEK